MKRCTKCGIDKPLEDFPMHSKQQRYHPWCKQCKWRAENEWKRRHRGTKRRITAASLAEEKPELVLDAIRLYKAGHTLEEIEKRLNVTCRIVRSWLIANDVQRRPNHARKGIMAGERSPSWKGGKSICDGYVLVKDGAGYEREHRLVAQEMLGRPFLPGEIVHHINSDRSDNRPENLSVMSLEEHCRLHHTRYQEDDLLVYVQVLHQRLGREPTVDDVRNDHTGPSLATFYRRLGSFSKAKQMIYESNTPLSRGVSL